MKKTILIAAAAALMGLAAQPAMAEVDGAKVFSKKCKMCHAIDRKKVGPAVKDMNTDTAVLKTTITEGRKSMPKLGSKLSEEEIDAVVSYLASQHQD